MAPDATGGPQVTLLFSDPFADRSTAFAFVFEHRGKIYLGPNASGDGAVRFPPDGSLIERVGFALPADVEGNATRNEAPPPYPGIGRSGCVANSGQCGPDNENGRGIFTAGIIGGQPWLALVGGRTDGDLNYVYMSADIDATLDFHYVDLSTRLGPQTKGCSAAHFFNGRLYLGFPDTGVNRPYLTVIKTPPPQDAPGLDVLTAGQAEDLWATDMPGIGDSADPSMIDAIVDFNGSIYLFNNGGCMRSTTATPAPYDTNPADWTSCTPSAVEYGSQEAITASKVVDIEPADKAFPQAAVFHGRLIAGRNTAAGPQLWACAPASSGDTAQCDPEDWSLLAANSVGDATLSQFGNPANAKASLVVATVDHLYVGFDNPRDGIVVFRSDNPAARDAADFTGQAACSAGQHPSGCAGIGGNGVGSAANTRILDAMASSGDVVYLTTGDGVGNVSIYRIAHGS